MNNIVYSAEELSCREDLASSQDEQPVESLTQADLERSVVFVIQGFEERSVGFIEKLAQGRGRVKHLVIAEYKADKTRENDLYIERMCVAAKQVAGDRITRVVCMNDGMWVREAVCLFPQDPLIVDITAVSNRAMFAVLDECSRSTQPLRIAYTEAKDYWPTKSEWSSLEENLTDVADHAKRIDECEWLYGVNFKHEFIEGHQGYDSACASRALVAFLPFKAARLAAVMREEYAHVLFVAGEPHAPTNQWRFDALLKINSEIVQSRRVEKMATFGYRKAAVQLLDLLFRDPGFLLKYDVHLAPLGSKLQEVACWLISRHIPGITVTTSVPKKYYPNAFSNGIGPCWVFNFAIKIRKLSSSQ